MRYMLRRSTDNNTGVIVVKDAADLAASSRPVSCSRAGMVEFAPQEDLSWLLRIQETSRQVE